MKIKKGDKVIVIAGKDKGKEGKVIGVDKQNNKVLVEGVNMVKKHVKARGPQQQAGIVTQEAPLDASNVMYSLGGKPVRLGYVVEEKGKVRVARPSGKAID